MGGQTAKGFLLILVVIFLVTLISMYNHCIFKQPALHRANYTCLTHSIFKVNVSSALTSFNCLSTLNSTPSLQYSYWRLKGTFKAPINPEDRRQTNQAIKDTTTIQKTDESAEYLDREMHFIPSLTIVPDFNFDAIKKILRGFTF